MISRRSKPALSRALLGALKTSLLLALFCSAPTRAQLVAPGIHCVPDCTYRPGNGKCAVYGSDFCGFQSSCVPHCTLRGSNGQCKVYSEDYCGPAAQCVPTCSLRAANGSCAIYGDDLCSQGYPVLY